MSVWSEIERQISEQTGERFAVTDRRSVAGGCINSAWHLLGGSRDYFVKLNRASLGDMFAAEADALEAIRATETVRVPQPICVGGNGEWAWLVLEYLELAAGCRGSAGTLGAELAAMHSVTAPTFGWHRDNTIGTTPQRNEPAREWCAFFGDRRLRYQLQRAAANGHGGRLQAAGQRLLASFPALFSDYAPSPSLLHGDLWGGNVAYRPDGEAVVFDPASYYGDRETDIAMTELFGGFPAEFYAAYEATLPLDPGYRVRKKLYNLYHVLNHLNLFGGGYRSQAESLLEQLFREI